MLLSSTGLAEAELTESDMRSGTGKNIERDVQIEIEEMHEFIVNWFNGKAEQSVFYGFMSRFDNEVHYIGTDGSILDRKALVGYLSGAHGKASDFRIEIRDVKTHHVSDSYIVATYTEWQRNASFSERPESGRRTTLVLSNSKPFRWLHIHETWLPEAIYKAGPYDF